MTIPLQLYKNLHPEWQTFLSNELQKDYQVDLATFIHDMYKTKTIYPAQENIFNAFNLCLPHTVKVIIIGQDPYHGPHQAHGLAFSVQTNNIPPSLKNIYKEIYTDTGKNSITNGNLTAWANQGVLLLNSVLTAEENKPGSHEGKGWELFTNAVIQRISELNTNIVFILWGTKAQQKELLISNSHNLILKSAHPSPLSAYRGFFGCRHFSQTNAYLKKHRRKTITW